MNKRGPSTPLDVAAEIRTLAAAGANGAQIERYLSERPEFADRLPGLRTIQKIASRVKVGEGVWSATAVSAEEARLVLPVLGELARRGIVTSLAPAMAAWIASVGRMRPDLDLYDVFRFAVRYQASAPDKRQAIDLDLARAPSAFDRAEWGRISNIPDHMKG